MMTNEIKFEEFIHRLLQMAKPYLQVRGGEDHIKTSHVYAKRLVQLEGGDKRVVEPAVILHDVGWSVLSRAEILKAYGVKAGGEEAHRLNRRHEIEGAKIAETILNQMSYEPGLIRKIVNIIQRHDSGSNGSTIEEKIVKDADKLWRFSELGFWQEAKRQKISALTLYNFIKKHRESWFLTESALDISRKELEGRYREIKQEKKSD